jgi:hypothetical protein
MPDASGRPGFGLLTKMGLVIQLQDELGNRIQGVEDPTNHLASLLPRYERSASYPMLASIDPYGDTYFNGLQIPRFLSEWADVVSKARTQDERELVAEIERLARRCSDEVHTYLKFIGD